jgi:molecular chaperone DnaK
MLENAVYQAEKMKIDYKDKISEEDLKTLDDAVAEAKTHLEATDKEELEKAAKDLSEKLMPIGAKMYESAQKEDAAEADKDTKQEKSDDKAGKDEPIEGEVVEDKSEDEKK